MCSAFPLCPVPMSIVALSGNKSWVMQLCVWFCDFVPGFFNGFTHYVGSLFL